MRCPNCGVENAENSCVCTACGAALTDARSRKPKRNMRIGVLLLALALFAMMALAAACTYRTVSEGADAPAVDAQPDGTTDEAPSETQTARPVTAYASAALMPAGAMETTIATFGDRTLSNRDLNDYYWGEYYYLSNYYGAQLGTLIDITKPLGEQVMNGSADGYTWQDFLLDNAESTMVETCALVQAAKQAGYAIGPDEEAYLSEMRSNILAYCEREGYASIDDYALDVYGPGASEQTLMAYLEESVLATVYAGDLFESYSFTEDEIRDYYEQHSGDYAALEQSDARNCAVRHILLMPEDTDSEDAWEQARAEAERLLALWQEQPTEARFAEMAGEYSTDPGSKDNGGLYTDVFVGQMVPAFNDWCFDESRTSGDTGIVKTSYGYHIMYFVSHNALPAWMETVEQDMRRDAYSNEIRALMDAAGYTLDYSRVVLVTPDSLIAE